MTIPVLPDRAALFLDMDGTLIDIAATPGAVVVAPGLADALLRVRAKLDDAVAIVSGRPVAQIDALLPAVAYAVAGEHGAAFRAAPGQPVELADLPTAPQSWRDAAVAAARQHPGALFEAKERGFVLHYRLAPAAGQALREALDAIIGGDARFVVMAAHMAWELKPNATDKGLAVSRLLMLPPFLDRVPVYVGDDVTDEDGMRVARAHGGLGLRVQDVFGDPAGVRAWLARLAAGADA